MKSDEPTLPRNRAFVVQFRVTEDHTQPHCAGRVEHLVSGQAVRFESWQGLQNFIEQALQQLSEENQ
jgi:hypothetical protein